jgi:hypothetical protein
MIRGKCRAAFGLICVLVFISSCAVRPAIKNPDLIVENYVQTPKVNPPSFSDPFLGWLYGFKFSKSTFPSKYSAKIAVDSPVVTYKQYAVSIDFTNLSDQVIAVSKECWGPLKISDTSTGEVVLPVSGLYTCTLPDIPATVLLPKESHIFQFNIWNGTDLNGKPVPPGKYTIRGEMELNYLGKVETVEATPLTIDVRSN